MARRTFQPTAVTANAKVRIDLLVGGGPASVLLASDNSSVAGGILTADGTGVLPAVLGPDDVDVLYQRVLVSGTPSGNIITLGAAPLAADSGTYATATVFQGSGGTDDQAAALQATVDGMTVGGKLTGELRVKGVVRLSAGLTLDGGYTAVTDSGNWTAGLAEPFRLVVEGALKPDAAVPVGVTARGMYSPSFDVRFYGGGSGRTVTDAAISASSSTLTSATAAFVAADVGRMVRVEGAGTSGEAPMIARIASRTNATTVVLDDTATTAVTGARCAIRTIGLHVADLIHADFSAQGRDYAGTLLYGDGEQQSGDDIITQSVLRAVRALSCGQAIALKHVQGGFGAILDVWDSNCADGSVITDAADLQIVHWENYSPSTQTSGLVLDRVFNLAASSIALGDNPSQSILKVVGGDGNVFDRLYLTSNAATKVGLDLVEASSCTIGTVQTDRCSVGVRIRGGAGVGITIRKHLSLTGDTVGTRVAAGPTTSYMQMVDIGGYWNYTGSQAVLVDSSVTGGRVKVHGQVDSTVNQTGGSGIKTVDCQSASVVLDVAGLTQVTSNGTVAAGVGHVTAANLLGLAQARLGNGPAPTEFPVVRVGTGYATDIANTTTATDIVTYTIPGNLLAAGATFRVRASGTFDNIATSGAFVWALKHGTQDVFWRNPSYGSAQTGAIWSIDATVVYRTVGASATAVGLTTYYSTVTGETAAAKQRTSTTVNTTVDQALHLVIAMATANAGNAIHVDTATIERLA